MLSWRLSGLLKRGELLSPGSVDVCRNFPICLRNSPWVSELLLRSSCRMLRAGHPGVSAASKMFQCGRGA